MEKNNINKKNNMKKKNVKNNMERLSGINNGKKMGMMSTIIMSILVSIASGYYYRIIILIKKIKKKELKIALITSLITVYTPVIVYIYYKILKNTYNNRRHFMITIGIIIATNIFITYLVYFRNRLSKEEIKNRLNKVEERSEEERSEEEIKKCQEKIYELYKFDYYETKNKYTHEEKYETEAKYLSEILDQGSCGSSVAHAVACCVAITYNKKNGTQITLSPQMFLSCREAGKGYLISECEKKKKCEGAYIIEYLKNMRDKQYGEFSYLPLKKDLPYMLNNCEGGGPCKNVSDEIVGNICKIETTKLKELKRHDGYVITKIYAIGKPNEKDLKQKIKENGCILAGLHVYENMYNDTYYYPYKYEKKEDEEYIGSHAVCLVGWDWKEENKYWKVKNSWGETHHNKGYFWVSDELVQYNIYSIEVEKKEIDHN